MAEDEDANDEQYIELQQVQGVQEERPKTSTVQYYHIQANGSCTH